MGFEKEVDQELVHGLGLKADATVPLAQWAHLPLRPQPRGMLAPDAVTRSLQYEGRSFAGSALGTLDVPFLAANGQSVCSIELPASPEGMPSRDGDPATGTVAQMTS